MRSPSRAAPRAVTAGAAVSCLLLATIGTASGSTHHAPAIRGHSATKAHAGPARPGAYGRHHATTAAAASGNMQYGGGPVQLSPTVYLVFWGSQWDSDTKGIPAYLTSMFQGLGAQGDNWSTITSQYTDSTGAGPAFTGPVYGGQWIDDSAPEPSDPSATDISAEADNAASHFNVAGDPNTQIVVVSAQGTHPDGWPNSGFCAWHNFSGSVSYTNLPYELDAPSGSRCPNNALGGQLDAFSIVEGHEYAESISDPQPSSGWVAPDGSEIGDVCESGFQPVTLSTGTFPMQPLWSNTASGCVISGS